MVKYKKSQYKGSWIQRGVKFTNEEFEFIWGVYENIDNCMICSKHLIGKDKCLDHNHDTGEVRYILCQKCNLTYGRKENKTNKLKLKHIHSYKNKGHEYFKIEIKRSDNHIQKTFSKNKYTLEDVIQIRDELVPHLH